MEVSIEGELPVVDMGSCPFPTLTDLSKDRSMCRLEERMISEAVGQPQLASHAEEAVADAQLGLAPHVPALVLIELQSRAHGAEDGRRLDVGGQESLGQPTS